MEKEKIDKVIALVEKRYKTNRDYRYMKEIIDNLYNHNYSNEGFVSAFFEDLKGSFVYSYINKEDLDEFYRNIFTTIENEWEKICNRQKERYEQIDKELEEL